MTAPAPLSKPERHRPLPTLWKHASDNRRQVRTKYWHAGFAADAPLDAQMCKTCVDKQFWDFQAKNLLFGPWGMISLILTPVYLVANTVAYASAKRALSSAVE